MGMAAIPADTTVLEELHNLLTENEMEVLRAKIASAIYQHKVIMERLDLFLDGMSSDYPWDEWHADVRSYEPRNNAMAYKHSDGKNRVEYSHISHEMAYYELENLFSC